MPRSCRRSSCRIRWTARRGSRGACGCPAGLLARGWRACSAVVAASGGVRGRSSAPPPHVHPGRSARRWTPSNRPDHARTVDAITLAGYEIDIELWPESNAGIRRVPPTLRTADRFEASMMWDGPSRACIASVSRVGRTVRQSQSTAAAVLLRRHFGSGPGRHGPGRCHCAAVRGHRATSPASSCTRWTPQTLRDGRGARGRTTRFCSVPVGANRPPGRCVRHIGGRVHATGPL